MIVCSGHTCASQDELFAHFNEHHDDLDAAKEGGLEVGDGGWKHAQKKKKLMMTSAASSASASASTLTPMASGLSSAGPSGGGLGGGASSVSVQASNRRPPQLQHGCPVCHKKFLLKKNLLSHIKRYHEDEGKVGQYHCTICRSGHKLNFFPVCYCVENTVVHDFNGH